MAWVYILRGKSGRYYIGSTDNLERRIAEHRRGSNHTTRRLGGEVELVAQTEVPSAMEARALEMKLKRKKGPQVAAFILQSLCSKKEQPRTPNAFAEQEHSGFVPGSSPGQPICRRKE